MTGEEFLLRLASQLIRRQEEQVGLGRDLNLSKKKPRDQRKSDERRVRLFINVGAVDVNDKGGFLSFLCEGAGITGSAVGKIDLQRIHTFFDVDESVADQVKKSFRHAEFNGRPLRVNTGDSTGSPKSKKKKKGKKKSKKK